MAVTRYGVASGLWSATAVWSATSGGAPGASAPGDTDTARFDANSAGITVTMDGNLATLAALHGECATATLAMGAHSLTANLIDFAHFIVTGTGAAVLTSHAVGGGDIYDADFSGFEGTFVWDNAGDILVGMYGLTNRCAVEKTGAGNLSLDCAYGPPNSFQTGDFTILAGTVTIIDYPGAELDVEGDFVLAGGTIDGNDKELAAHGSVTYTAGTATDLKITQDGTGNLAWDTVANPLAEYTASAGAVVTLTGHVDYKKATIEAGASLSGNFSFRAAPTANNFLNMAGTIGETVDVTIGLTSSLSNSGIVAANTLLVTGADDVLTQSGVLTADTTAIAGDGDGEYAQLILAVDGCDLGAAALGTATGTDRHGKLNTAGYTMAIDSLVDLAGGSSEVILGSSAIYLNGGWDAENIAIVNTAAVIYGKDKTSAHLDYVDVSGSNPLTAFFCGDDGNNTDVTFVDAALGSAYAYAAA